MQVKTEIVCWMVNVTGLYFLIQDQGDNEPKGNVGAEVCRASRVFFVLSHSWVARGRRGRNVNHRQHTPEAERLLGDSFHSAWFRSFLTTSLSPV